MTNKRQKNPGTPRTKRRSQMPQKTKAQVLRQLKKEAQHLGLTTEEYVRLILNVSSTLRTGLAEGKEIDGKQLLKWLENPVFLAMIQWVSQYAMSAMNGESTASESQKDNNPEQTGQQPNNASNGTATQQPQPIPMQQPQPQAQVQPAPRPQTPQWQGRRPLPVQPPARPIPMQQPMQQRATNRPPEPWHWQ